MDVAVSAYSDLRPDYPGVRYQHHFDGSKLGGVLDFFNQNSEALDGRYSHIWLVEDDLYIPERTAWIVTQFAELAAFHLFAPTVSQDSHFNHRITISNESFCFRVVDFVEQMNPVFSLDLFKKCLPHFDENFSGFGQEWLWNKYVQGDKGLSANLDCACIYHTRKSGQGTLYKANPKKIDPRQELETFMRHHDLVKARTNLVAVAITDTIPRFLTGISLVERGVIGYRMLAKIDPRTYAQVLQEFAENTLTAQLSAKREVLDLLERSSTINAVRSFVDLAA